MFVAWIDQSTLFPPTERHQVSKLSVQCPNHPTIFLKPFRRLNTGYPEICVLSPAAATRLFVAGQVDDRA
jgi:hypothetical protein